jgi:dipeptidase E
VSRQIIAMGGGVLAPDTGNRALERYVLEATGARRPRVLFVGTASGDDLSYIARFYESYAALDCTPSHLSFFKRTPPDLRALVHGQDVVHVGGGNTRSMLAVWREWELDAILRDALERGVVLCGSSAGSICWFEEGITDSIAGDLTRMTGLGFLAGSNCPHYDGEPARRPAYQRMVAEGVIAPGYAADDGAALHFVDGALHAVVSSRPNATAYRVERDGDAAREARLGARAL